MTNTQLKNECLKLRDPSNHHLLPFARPILPKPPKKTERGRPKPRQRKAAKAKAEPKAKGGAAKRKTPAEKEQEDGNAKKKKWLIYYDDLYVYLECTCIWEAAWYYDLMFLVYSFVVYVQRLWKKSDRCQLCASVLCHGMARDNPAQQNYLHATCFVVWNWCEAKSTVQTWCPYLGRGVFRHHNVSMQNSEYIILHIWIVKAVSATPGEPGLSKILGHSCCHKTYFGIQKEWQNKSCANACCLCASSSDTNDG